MQELQQILIDLGGILWQLVKLLVIEVGGLALRWALALSWIAWCLWAVDWRKMWLRLAEGAWVPFVLLGVMVAAVWGWMFPSEVTLLGAVTLPNFWWQLAALAGILGVALLCGWLQGLLHWPPAEVELHPAVEHGHDHAHDHGH